MGQKLKARVSTPKQQERVVRDEHLTEAEAGSRNPFDKQKLTCSSILCNVLCIRVDSVCLSDPVFSPPAPLPHIIIRHENIEPFRPFDTSAYFLLMLVPC